MAARNCLSSKEGRYKLPVTEPQGRYKRLLEHASELLELALGPHWCSKLMPKVAGRSKWLVEFGRDWVLDETMSLQKIVLLNLTRLKDLGVEYCRYLRKSEDLALCYDVMQRQGCHVLKVQSHCYRAIHLEISGAELVRLGSKRNRTDGDYASLVGELIHGGEMSALSIAHQKKALIQWFSKAQQRGVDARGDRNDGSESASPILLRELALAASCIASPDSKYTDPANMHWCFPRGATSRTSTTVSTWLPKLRKHQDPSAHSSD
jgi:hypothetical protein